MANFNLYLQSPYHNKDKSLIKLNDAILKFYPNFNITDKQVAKIYKTVFGKTYNQNYFRVQLSALTEQAENFLAQQYYEQSKPLKTAHKLRALNQANHNKLFKKVRKQHNTTQGETSVRSESHYLYEYMIKQIEVDYYVNNESRNFEKGLNDLVTSLDEFYLSSRLKLICEQLSQGNVFGRSEADIFPKQIATYAKQASFNNNPVVVTYLNLYHSLTEPHNEDWFFRIKNNLKDYQEQLTKEDLLDVYVYATNYCVRKVNAGASKYLTELFDLYKFALVSELLLIEGYIEPFLFKNIVSVALRCKAYEWTKLTIDSHKNKIEKEHRPTAMAYNLANYYFYTEAYSKSQQQLFKVEFLDVVYATDYRALLIKIYFEQNEFDALDSILESFATFLRRQKISINLKKAYSNFTKLTKQISRTSPRDTKRLQLIKTRINEARPLADRQWLLDKVDELLG